MLNINCVDNILFTRPLNSAHIFITK